MRLRKWIAVSALLLSLPGAAVASSGELKAVSDLSAAGWRVRSTGWLTPLPAITATAGPARIEGEAALVPGSGASCSHDLALNPAAPGVLLGLRADDFNRTSRDYRDGKAEFPVSITLVFGKDSRKISLGKRFTDFFSGLWNGFPPGGIRLTYVLSAQAPAGSMFRLSEEETVFVLGGEEDKGKKIESKRSPKADFTAAYGQGPEGPVTGVVVRAERPSSEHGNAGVAFSFSEAPAP
jgi:hypothetical protein